MLFLSSCQKKEGEVATYLAVISVVTLGAVSLLTSFFLRKGNLSLKPKAAEGPVIYEQDSPEGLWRYFFVDNGFGRVFCIDRNRDGKIWDGWRINSDDPNCSTLGQGYWRFLFGYRTVNPALPYDLNMQYRCLQRDSNLDNLCSSTFNNNNSETISSPPIQNYPSPTKGSAVQGCFYLTAEIYAQCENGGNCSFSPYIKFNSTGGDGDIRLERDGIHTAGWNGWNKADGSFVYNPRWTGGDIILGKGESRTVTWTGYATKCGDGLGKSDISCIFKNDNGRPLLEGDNCFPKNFSNSSSDKSSSSPGQSTSPSNPDKPDEQKIPTTVVFKPSPIITPAPASNNNLSPSPISTSTPAPSPTPTPTPTPSPTPTPTPTPPTNNPMFNACVQKDKTEFNNVDGEYIADGTLNFTLYLNHNSPEVRNFLVDNNNGKQLLDKYFRVYVKKSSRVSLGFISLDLPSSNPINPKVHQNKGNVWWNYTYKTSLITDYENGEIERIKLDITVDGLPRIICGDEIKLTEDFYVVLGFFYENGSKIESRELNLIPKQESTSMGFEKKQNLINLGNSDSSINQEIDINHVLTYDKLVLGVDINDVKEERVIVFNREDGEFVGVGFFEVGNRDVFYRVKDGQWEKVQGNQEVDISEDCLLGSINNCPNYTFFIKKDNPLEIDVIATGNTSVGPLFKVLWGCNVKKENSQDKSKNAEVKIKFDNYESLKAQNLNYNLNNNSGRVNLLCID